MRKIFFLSIIMITGNINATELQFKYPSVSYTEFKSQTDKKIFLKNLINDIDSAWEKKQSIICRDVITYKLIKELHSFAHFQVQCSKTKDDFLVTIPYTHKLQPLSLECKIAKMKFNDDASCKGKL